MNKNIGREGGRERGEGGREGGKGRGGEGREEHTQSLQVLSSVVGLCTVMEC